MNGQNSIVSLIKPKIFIKLLNQEEQSMLYLVPSFRKTHKVFMSLLLFRRVNQ